MMILELIKKITFRVLIQGPPSWPPGNGGNPPPPPPNWPGPCNGTTCIPIDQGIWILIIMAIALVIYNFKNKKVHS